MADQPQESAQHPIPDRRNPQAQQSKYLGVDRREAHPEVPGGNPNPDASGGEPETVPRDVEREKERDKEPDKDRGYN